MLNAEELLRKEMEAFASNSPTNKTNVASSNDWLKYFVYGGAIVLAIAGIYYVNREYQKKRSLKSEE